MRLKLDENIPASVVPRLRQLGYDVDTVLDEHLGGAADTEVWAKAQEERRMLVTQDLDFSDTRKFEPGTHSGILLVRLPDTEQWRLGDYLAGWLSEPEARTWGRCFVVATPVRLRVRRP